MSIIFFDVETTGLPEKRGYNGYYPPGDTDKYNESRIVQLAYIVVDNNKEKKINMVIYPDNFIIRNSDIHGISHEKAKQDGKCIKIVLESFKNELEKCELLVSHNIMFDLNVVLSECYRYKLLDIVKVLENIKKYCTMSEGKKKMGERKNPKLVELYSYYYPEKKWIQKHDALDDVEKCLECYKKMEVYSG